MLKWIYAPSYYTCQLASTRNIKQESPPAWTQEAYRPPCSKYSFCCQDLAGRGYTARWYLPIWTWLGGTLQGIPPGRVPPQQGIPPCLDLAGPCWVLPWAGYPPCLDLAGPGWVPPPRCGQTECWMDGWMDRHVSKHNLPSYSVRGR